MKELKQREVIESNNWAIILRMVKEGLPENRMLEPHLRR